MPHNFKELFFSHKEKISSKWERYLDVYDQEFIKYRDLNNFRLLEIGVQNGGSLEIYSKYFSNPNLLIGCDIDVKCARLKFECPCIHVITGDILSESTLSDIQKLSSTFDVIIDDGSHTSKDIVNTFCLLFDSLNPGGMYIIEDLHCSYWKKFEGGLYHPVSAIAFLKKMVDYVNHEHFGIYVTVNDFFKPFIVNYSSKIQNIKFQDIYSISFFNSVCIIKKELGKGKLGGRKVTGERADVNPRASLDQKPILNESENMYTACASPEETVFILAKRVNELMALLKKSGLKS